MVTCLPEKMEQYAKQYHALPDKSRASDVELIASMLIWKGTAPTPDFLSRGESMLITHYRCSNYTKQDGKGICRIYETRPEMCKGFPVYPKIHGLFNQTERQNEIDLLREHPFHKKKSDWRLEEIAELKARLRTLEESVLAEHGSAVERADKLYQEQQRKIDGFKSHPRCFKIVIDHKPFEHPEQFITGREIKGYVNASAYYGVWLKNVGTKRDVEIKDQEMLDLSVDGRIYFFTGVKEVTEGSCRAESRRV